MRKSVIISIVYPPTTPAFSHPSFPEGGEWRILSTIKLLLNTIDYQIIIFSINFTTKFEEEPIFS